MLNTPSANYISESAMVQVTRDAMIDDAAALLDALPDASGTAQADRNVEQQNFNALMHLLHGGEIEVWTKELVSMLEKLQSRKRKSISLLDLICTLELSRIQSKCKDCLIELWLAFLLGKHRTEIRSIAERGDDVEGFEP